MTNPTPFAVEIVQLAAAKGLDRNELRVQCCRILSATIKAEAKELGEEANAYIEDCLALMVAAMKTELGVRLNLREIEQFEKKFKKPLS